MPKKTLSSREATFDYSESFRSKFEGYKSSAPKIVEKLREFVERKTKRPPDKMPGEHKLNPPFDGVSQCHLDGDICLLFQDKGDKVSLLTLATHDEMSGKRGNKLAKKLKKQS